MNFANKNGRAHLQKCLGISKQEGGRLMVSISEAVKVWRGSKEKRKHFFMSYYHGFLLREDRRAPTYTPKHVPVACLHTGQTLICAMGEVAVLLYVKGGSSGYCFLCADCNSFTPHWRKRKWQKQSTRAGDKTWVVLSVRCLNVSVCLAVWSKVLPLKWLFSLWF